MGVTVPDWVPEWDTTNPPGYTRISAGHLRPGICPEHAAKKARPDVYAHYPDGTPYPANEPGMFPLGLVRAAVLRILTSPPARVPRADPSQVIRDAVGAEVSESGDVWDPTSIAVAERGVAGYLNVFNGLLAAGTLRSVRVFSDMIVATGTGPDLVETYAWAIYLAGENGRVRETHVLRWRNASRVRLTPAQVAVFAHTGGSGFVAEPKTRKTWKNPYRPIRAPLPLTDADRVRVRVVGVLDQTDDTRFDGTPAEAEAAYDRELPAVIGVYAGRVYIPGRDCATCPIRPVCPGLPRIPGFLGVTGYAETGTRAVSPSNLWTYDVCPRQAHLKTLGLPQDTVPGSDSMNRGTLVHTWLAAAHARGVPCTVSDLPPSNERLGPAGASQPVPEGIAADLGWTTSEYAAARPYLLQHLPWCPYVEADVADLVNEVPVTVYDTDANVILSTRPDTAYTDAGPTTVIREVKTMLVSRLPDPDAVLTRFPQAAAAVCALADEHPAFPVTSRRRVEVEMLAPGSGRVDVFDASDPATVLTARTVLAGKVDPWLHDTTHPVGHLPPCTWCPVQSHCEPEGDVLDVDPDILTGILSSPAAAAAVPPSPGIVALLSGWTPADEDDDDVPF